MVAADFGEPARGPSPDAHDAPGVAVGLKQALTELVARAETTGDQLARQCARGALTVVEFLDGALYPAPGRNLRNEAMAENLRTLLAREQRIVVGGHNVHLQRTPSFDGTTTIGMLLADELGDDLVVIGGLHTRGAVPDLDLADGPDGRYPLTGPTPSTPDPHTLEAALGSSGHPVQLVDLRRLSSHALDGITATRAQSPHQTILMDIDAHRTFDAALHVHNITPARGAID